MCRGPVFTWSLVNETWVPFICHHATWKVIEVHSRLRPSVASLWPDTLWYIAVHQCSLEKGQPKGLPHLFPTPVHNGPDHTQVLKMNLAEMDVLKKTVSFTTYLAITTPFIRKVYDLHRLLATWNSAGGPLVPWFQETHLSSCPPVPLPRGINWILNTWLHCCTFYM